MQLSRRQIIAYAAVAVVVVAIGVRYVVLPRQAGPPEAQAVVLAPVAASPAMQGAAGGAAAEYPERPIGMVIPYGPGGATGSVAVQNAKPDGYTMLFARVGSHGPRTRRWALIIPGAGADNAQRRDCTGSGRFRHRLIRFSE